MTNRQHPLGPHTTQSQLPPGYEMNWEVANGCPTNFSWEYNDHRKELLALYEKSKREQWDAQTRIDWTIETDPKNPMGIDETIIPLYGTELWGKLSQQKRDDIIYDYNAYLIGAFIHGEQGAMISAAKIIESAPDHDAKWLATTQAIDESRHIEAFGKFAHRIDMIRPVQRSLMKMYEIAFKSDKWDLVFLNSHVVAEGWGMGSMQLMRDNASNPLAKSMLAYIMQDEARHIAFGRYILKDFYKNLTPQELMDREDYLIACVMWLYARLDFNEILDHHLDMKDVGRQIKENVAYHKVKKHMMSRIVPIIKEIGLLTPRIQKTFTKLGILENVNLNFDDMWREDDEIAASMEETIRNRLLQVGVNPNIL
jgi:hypothetical protein